jgi:hypothetical protein
MYICIDMRVDGHSHWIKILYIPTSLIRKIHLIHLYSHFTTFSNVCKVNFCTSFLTRWDIVTKQGTAFLLLLKEKKNLEHFPVKALVTIKRLVFFCRDIFSFVPVITALFTSQEPVLRLLNLELQRQPCSKLECFLKTKKMFFLFSKRTRLTMALWTFTFIWMYIVDAGISVVG